MVSIIAATPVSALNLRVSSPLGGPVNAPLIERLPKSRSIVETSIGSGVAPSAMILLADVSLLTFAPSRCHTSDQFCQTYRSSNDRTTTRVGIELSCPMFSISAIQ